METRHYTDQLFLSLQQRESAYNVAVSPWESSTATLMTDVTDETVHEQWDDVVTGADLIRQGAVVSSDQAIAQTSVHIGYAELRAKPHTLAGLMALALGTCRSTQQRWLTAYRHALTPSAPGTLPSISAMTGHQGTAYRVYGGIKSQGFTLSVTQASPYVSFSAALSGAGSRVPVSPGAFPGSILETWLRYGDCQFYVLDVTDTPLALPVLPSVVTPQQGASTMGGGAATLSSRVLACQVQWTNIPVQPAYRVSTGLQRSNPAAAQQRLQWQVTLHVATAQEATELAWYLTQRRVAVEWQCRSSTVIDPVTITVVTAGTPPRYHTVTDSNGGTWYLSVNLLGEVVIAGSPPSGTGLNVGTGLLLRALDGWQSRLGVNPRGEAITPHVAFVGTSPHVVDVCALVDSNGGTWYLWQNGLGEVVTSRSATPIVPWRHGFSVLCPRVQWQAVTRGQQHQADTLTFTGTALDDGQHAPIMAWVYNQQAAYLQ